MKLPRSERPPLLKAGDRLGQGLRFILDPTGGGGKRSAAMGRRFASRAAEFITGSELDIIGIQYHGGVMASVGSTALNEQGYKTRMIGYYPKGFASLSGDGSTCYLDDVEPRSVPQVLVDNSVHSGKTLKTAVDTLAGYGFYPTTFIKMVNYDDETDAVAEQIAADANMRCISLYDAGELGGCSYISNLDRIQVWMGAIGSLAFDARTKLPLVEP